MSLLNLPRAAVFSVLLFGSLVFEGCAQHAAPPSQPVAVVNPEGQPWNDAALFLAGMPGRPESAYKKFENTEPWKRYSTEFNSTWSKAEKEQYAAVDTFQKRELANVATGQFVFYPFSGPDVIYATRFFPAGKTYVFAGLEPVGSIERVKAVREEVLERELQGWRQSVASIFNRSFFVTSEMDRQLRGKDADGLLPVMLLLLARSGYEIDHVRYGQLSESGDFLDEPAGVKKHQGVEIGFMKAGDKDVRKVYYFSTNLIGDFNPLPPFMQFVAKQGKPDTLVKSASFLLHWQQCAGMRRFILDNSNIILQDDTGIPFRYFTAPEWQVSLFGQYSPPDRPFKKEFQKDLAAAFEDTANVRELGFSLGYGAGRRPSSMMLARRVKASSGAD